MKSQICFISFFLAAPMIQL